MKFNTIMMKAFIFTLLSMAAAFYAAGETDSTKAETFLWPIEGKNAGEGIISKPQEYIGQELNIDDLFIGAEEGAVVVAPENGTLDSYFIGYNTSLSTGTSMRMETGDHSFDSMLKEARNEKYSYPVQYKYVTGTIGLKTGDGKTIYISGLEGGIPLKTGMPIKKGDIIGTAGYAYKGFDQPHICLSITEKGTISDPMSPFGLRTSFIGPQAAAIPDTLSSEEAIEDYRILMASIREAYPSLHDVVAPEELEKHDSSNIAFLRNEETIKYQNFYDIVAATTALVHDSHLSILTPNPVFSLKRFYVPNIMFAKFGDSLVVNYVQQGYEEFLGKCVVSVDGIDSKTYIENIGNSLGGYDGKNESVKDYVMAISWNHMYENKIAAQRTVKLKFSDGIEFSDQWTPNSMVTGIVPAMNRDSVDYYERKSSYLRKPYSFKTLNDSVSYFGLGTFDLNETQLEEIEDSLASMFGKPNLIIDMRYNRGGSVDTERRMASWFLNSPSRKTETYSVVTKPGHFESFRYCLNYDSTMVLFPQAERIKGKTGYYFHNTGTDPIIPDSVLNYKGKIYILTDETSISAASVFPSVLVRNHRAVTVGRETASGYHFLTAVNFAQIRLPNSFITVRIPLVKDVFDTTVTERTPAGRGLMPDYPVPLSYDELYRSREDIILSKALELIDEGKYLGENPFAGIDEPQKSSTWIYIVSCIGIVAAITIGIAIYTKERGKREHGRK